MHTTHARSSLPYMQLMHWVVRTRPFLEDVVQICLSDPALWCVQALTVPCTCSWRGPMCLGCSHVKSKPSETTTPLKRNRSHFQSVDVSYCLKPVRVCHAHAHESCKVSWLCCVLSPGYTYHSTSFPIPSRLSQNHTTTCLAPCGRKVSPHMSMSCPTRANVITVCSYTRPASTGWLMADERMTVASKLLVQHKY